MGLGLGFGLGLLESCNVIMHKSLLIVSRLDVTRKPLNKVLP